MQFAPCLFRGGTAFQERRIEYLYSHGANYLLVPTTPASVCLSCGIRYYQAGVLEEIERRFFTIQRHEEQPVCSIAVPVKAFV